MWYIAVVIVAFATTLAYFNIKFSYWKRKEVAFFPAKIPWGSFRNIMENNLYQQVEAFYKYFRYKQVSYGGIYLFTNPIFVPINPSLIRQILVKDFWHFSSRVSYHNMRDQKLCAHVFHAYGHKWRMLSAKVKKVLSPPKIRLLIPTMQDSYAPLVGLLDFYVSQGLSVDLKSLVENITRDVLMNCVLGMDANEDFKWFEDCLLVKSKKEVLLDHVRRMYPNVARYYGVLNYPREAEEFFAKTVLKYIKKRHCNSISHKDFLQLLMEIHNHDYEIDDLPEEDKLTMYDIINQCFFFYIHGFSATVKVLSFALYELARSERVQNKIRTEIMHSLEKNHGKFGYDELNELKYLEQVVQEILRKHPPITVLERKCTRRYKLPQVDKYLERGTFVVISIAGVHKDEIFYPDPEKFEPERFSEKHMEKYEKQCVYMPFGEGRRSCPGELLPLIVHL